ncbi:MAG: hypothetical protein KIT27_09800 [Legionellales bacterium]|nr:hypothetical protein [Legionellales bacterium]
MLINNTFGKITTLMLSSLILAGCAGLSRQVSQFQMSENPAYLTSQQEHALQIPAGLSADNIHEKYPLPPITNTRAPAKINLMPPHSEAMQLINQQRKLPAQ